MSRKQKQRDKQLNLMPYNMFRNILILLQEECCRNLGIGLSTFSRWKSQYADNGGDIPVRGSGTSPPTIKKEIARLKRELRDATDALDVLKKAIGILGGKMTKAIYEELVVKVEDLKAMKRKFSISGMLKFLGVSRSGFRAL